MVLPHWVDVHIPCVGSFIGLWSTMIHVFSPCWVLSVVQSEALALLTKKTSSKFYVSLTSPLWFLKNDTPRRFFFRSNFFFFCFRFSIFWKLIVFKIKFFHEIMVLLQFSVVPWWRFLGAHLYHCCILCHKSMRESLVVFSWDVELWITC